MNQLYLVTGEGASTISFIVMMVAMIALFYFMLIRPQQKQQKKVNDMLNNLKIEMPFSRRAIGTVEDADVENEL